MHKSMLKRRQLETMYLLPPRTLTEATALRVGVQRCAVDTLSALRVGVQRCAMSLIVARHRAQVDQELLQLEERHAASVLQLIQRLG